MPLPNLSYNGYSFAPASVWFTINKRSLIGQTGRKHYVQEMWHVKGRVSGTTSNEVMAAMAALEASLNDGGDLVFSLYHQLLSANCTEGVHVRQFKWLPGYDGVRGSGAELLLRRTFQIVFEGTTIAASDTPYTFYQESVRGVGTGGPIILPVGSMFGAVQAQQTQVHTDYEAIQSGVAIGLTEYPAASTPIWNVTPGVHYYPKRTTVELETPRSIGVNFNTQFPIRWRYHCWSTVPLVMSPIIMP